MNSKMAAQQRLEQLLNTTAGQRMLANIEKEIEQERIDLSLLKQEHNEIQSYISGAYWANKYGNKEEVILLDDRFHVVKTDDLGRVKDLELIKNGYNLSPQLAQQFEQLDPIAYDMYRDGTLPLGELRDREYYEKKHDIVGQPLNYLHEIALGHVTQAEQIKEQFSTEGRLVAKKMLNELENKISALEVSLGYRKQFEDTL